MTQDAEHGRRLSLANAREVAEAAHGIDQASQADHWRAEADRLHNDLAAERAAHAATRAALEAAETAAALLGRDKVQLVNDAAATRRAWLYGRPR